MSLLCVCLHGDSVFMGETGFPLQPGVKVLFSVCSFCGVRPKHDEPQSCRTFYY